jgi:hypothetical protein
MVTPVVAVLVVVVVVVAVVVVVGVEGFVVVHNVLVGVVQRIGTA